MDILGVGPLELILILLVALIVLGPNDMIKAGRTVGRALRKVVTSGTWQMVQQTSRDLRNLPNALIREAGLEDEAQQLQEGLKLNDIQADIQKELDDLKDLDKGVQKDVKADIQKELDDLKDLEKDVQKDLSDWTTPIEPEAEQKSVDKETPIEDQSIVESTGESEPVIDPRSADGPPEPSSDEIADDNKTIESQSEG